jgi:phosphoribosylanthranilate isomerase
VTQLKVSGVVRPEDAEVAARLGIDFVACMFFPGSPRYVTIEQVWDIRRALASRCRLIGVFVDAPMPIVQRVAEHCRLDFVQLFGSEPRTAVDALRPPAFKAATVNGHDEADAVARGFLGRRTLGTADPALLLHFPDAAGNVEDLLPAIARRSNVIVASAAWTPDTVGPALLTCHPWAVDVWDAVESQPGRIDAARLEAFTAAVRASSGGAAPSA